MGSLSRDEGVCGGRDAEGAARCLRQRTWSSANIDCGRPVRRRLRRLIGHGSFLVRRAAGRAALPPLVAILLAAVAVFAAVWICAALGRDRTSTILDDIELWRNAPDHEKEAIARSAISSMPGFTFTGMGRFSCGETTVSIALARHAPTGLEFSLIPAGATIIEFTDRNTGETTHRRHELKRPLLICRTEVTTGSLRAVGGMTASADTDPRLPATSVSWEDANAWSRQLGLRLPTASEWAYCCWAGSTLRWPHGDAREALHRYAWLSPTGGERLMTPHAVADLEPNAFGLFDMLGNVEEWCVDGSQYDSSFPGDLTGDVYATYRVHCGGSIDERPDEVSPRVVRFNLPTVRSELIGFRYCATVEWPGSRTRR